MAGAELAPVKAASQPIRIGSVCAMAGRGNENADAAAVAAVPIANSRRVVFMSSSLKSVLFSQRLPSYAYVFALRLLQMRDVVLIEREAPTWPLRHDRLPTFKFDG